MMQADTIKQLIAQGLATTEILVEGDDGTHFQAIVVSDEFAGKSAVQQHQLVYKTLGSKMGTEIHALALQTYTPEQWAANRALNG
ncbi:MAG: BolA/IbaG family iron-sulfur metabolism protein [Gammaproteobacteria bacterium]